MLGSLDSNVNVSVMAVPLPLWADAVKFIVFPTSRLALGPGVSETLAGTWFFTTCVEVPLLHETRSPQPISTHTSDVAGTNLRMNPSAKKLALLENSQFRGCTLFQQPAPIAVVSFVERL
jgi:hypothetical protein